MRLRDLREDNDITQNQIASVLNIRQNTYSQYENEKRQMPIELLWKLADYYNTSIDYLVGRTNTKQRTAFDKISNAVLICKFAFNVRKNCTRH